MFKTFTAIVLMLLTLTFSACRDEAPDALKNQQAQEVLEVKEYYDHGTLRITGMSVDGKRSGLWRSYYPNGMKWSETNFKDGVKEGPTVTYFANGFMRYNGFYHDEGRSGIWTFYDTLGTVQARIDMDTSPQKADSLLTETPQGL